MVVVDESETGGLSEEEPAEFDKVRHFFLVSEWETLTSHEKWSFVKIRKDLKRMKRAGVPLQLLSQFILRVEFAPKADKWKSNTHKREPEPTPIFLHDSIEIKDALHHVTDLDCDELQNAAVASDNPVLPDPPIASTPTRTKRTPPSPLSSPGLARTPAREAPPLPRDPGSVRTADQDAAALPDPPGRPGWSRSRAADEDPLDTSFEHDCDGCDGKWEEGEVCPLHGPLRVIHNTEVPMGAPQRAVRTLPPQLAVRPSGIAGAGLGVWSTEDVPAMVRFGPYEGEATATDRQSGYAWRILVHDAPDYFLDGEDETKSNWMRYVNCSRSAAEQNLHAYQHDGRVYYRTVQPVPARTELLVWYGDSFAEDLGIQRASSTHVKQRLSVDEEPTPSTPGPGVTDAAHREQSAESTESTPADGSPKPRPLKRQRSSAELSSDTENLPLWKRLHRSPTSHAGVDAVLPEPAPAEATHVDDDSQRHSSPSSDTDALPLWKRLHPSPARSAGTDAAVREPSTTAEAVHADDSPGSGVENLSLWQRLHAAPHPSLSRCSSSSSLPSLYPDTSSSSDSEAEAARRNLRRSIRISTHRLRSGLRARLKTAARRRRRYRKLKLIRSYEGRAAPAPKRPSSPRPSSKKPPYERCPVCGWLFSKRVAMQDHVRNRHTGELPHRCDTCGVAFAVRQNYNKHLLCHPTACAVCEVRFEDGVALKLHLREHPGAARYVCRDCQIPFRSGNALARHIKDYHTLGRRQHPCPHCGVAYRTVEQLRVHTRVHADAEQEQEQEEEEGNILTGAPRAAEGREPPRQHRQVKLERRAEADADADAGHASDGAAHTSSVWSNWDSWVFERTAEQADLADDGPPPCGEEDEGAEARRRRKEKKAKKKKKKKRRRKVKDGAKKEKEPKRRWRIRVCMMCGKDSQTFASKEALLEHIREAHLQGRAASYLF